jgi:hypothetical protein
MLLSQTGGGVGSDGGLLKRNGLHSLSLVRRPPPPSPRMLGTRIFYYKYFSLITADTIQSPPPQKKSFEFYCKLFNCLGFTSSIFRHHIGICGLADEAVFNTEMYIKDRQNWL